MPIKAALLTGASLLFLSGCVASSGKNITLEQGPPVQTVSTPYNTLVQCIAGQNVMTGTWAVGEITDATGKIATDLEGTGRFVSQGAGDMVQTILRDAGAEKTVNRRDPRLSIMEVKWGILKPDNFMPMDYYISGSINTLDFIPGAAAEVTIAGIGPRYRQHRALVGLDLHLTDARTTEVIGAVNISKQIFADEAGFGIGRFFGSTLVDVDFSAGNREPLQLSLRSMLQFGLYSLLKQTHPSLAEECEQIVDAIEGVEETTAASGDQPVLKQKT
ncbi:CsgG/HfaB family protein [Sneathiella chinensis]|uniref:Curli production assembly/transport component CsgG n=1 Tax=Sneathiella chinensis TaxID=349750 RepID=A0ABQ5U693_9PROT|nr:CsgG/HfaB family protein [Sneathiella chinensis]GLQ07642.1 hypothetical protein GCM10007924_28630 [Sneathiella chinensis]